MPYRVSPLRTVCREEDDGFGAGFEATGLGLGFCTAALVTAGFGLEAVVVGVRGCWGRVLITVVVVETGRGEGVTTGGGGVLEASTGASGSGSLTCGCDERRHCEGLSAHAST